MFNECGITHVDEVLNVVSKLENIGEVTLNLSNNCLNRDEMKKIHAEVVAGWLPKLWVLYLANNRAPEDFYLNLFKDVKTIDIN